MPCKTSIVCRWNTFCGLTVSVSWINQPWRSWECSVVGINSDWLFPGLPVCLFPAWKSLGVKRTHASYVFLKRSALTPRVVFQSDFCFCMWNSKRAQIRRNQIAYSIFFFFSVLPTLATDCTDLHANDHIYIPGERAKHWVPLIADWLFVKRKKTFFLQSTKKTANLIPMQSDS